MLLNRSMVLTFVSLLLITHTLHAQNWDTKGNTNLLSNSFLGTKDEFPLSIRTKNIERIIVGTDGRIFSNGWWGLSAEPEQSYRLTVGGDIKAGGIYLKAAHTELINATDGKDLVFKAANKEYMRMYKSGQGITIPVFVGIGGQPDGVNQLYVNGNTYSKSIKTNNLTITNNLQLQNDKSTFSVSDGKIMLKKWVGINAEPEEDYSLAVNGDSHFTGAIHIGDIPKNRAKDFKLAIDGKAICEEVKVQLKKDWPDYVFDPSYNLMPLDEVEKFITKNKHLPGLPSAQEIKAQEGIELGNMQALLLQKIEELTLHLIELKKENEILKKKIE